MEKNAQKTKFDLATWSNLAKLGSNSAISGIAQMVNQDLKITTFNLEEVSMKNATSLIGKPDDQIVGIYLMFTGNADGHIMLAFPPPTAYELVDMAMGLPPGSTDTLGEMEKSVLGEIGNIAGSFFLNAIADIAGSRLSPSPPVVVVDMAGAIMGSVLAEVFEEKDSAFAIKLVFATPTREIEGRFLVLPMSESSASKQEE